MKDQYLLGEILVKRGNITKEQLDYAIAEQRDRGGYLGKVIIEMGYATHDEVCEALSNQLNIEYIKLSANKINKRAVYIFPDYIVKEYMVLPIDLKGDELTVAMTDPLNLYSIQTMKHVSGYKIIPVLTTEKDLEQHISKFFGPMRKAEVAMKEISVDNLEKEDEANVKSVEKTVSEAPVIRLVNSIINGAVDQSASDIHLEPQEDTMIVRYRIDGVLYDRMKIPKDLQANLISRIKIMSGMDIAEKRRSQDGRIGINHGKRFLDLRVSTLPIVYGEKTVIRILDKSSLLLGLDSLGMYNSQLNTFKSFLNKPYGIILVTGPTGSGKTTSLYAALNTLNTREKNIITVEDPIEYEIKGINQVQVNNRAGITFAKGMRHILRQDPDVIMIGEIRDYETAQIAIQAALTGHLVFSTLHTNDASSAIIRLLDMKIEPFLITSTVIGVIGQRLLRMLCPHCKKESVAPPELVRSIKDKLPS
ncbi:GspE/PulE family protein [Candidatus Omnitrophota bacterium]